MRVFEVQHVSSSMWPKANIHLCTSLSVAFLINASDSSTFLSVCRMEHRWANARQGLGDRLFSGRSKPSRWRRRRRRERSGLQGLPRWQMMSRRCMGDRRAEGADSSCQGDVIGQQSPSICCRFLLFHYFFCSSNAITIFPGKTLLAIHLSLCLKTACYQSRKN